MVGNRTSVSGRGLNGLSRGEDHVLKPSWAFNLVNGHLKYITQAREGLYEKTTTDYY